ncbi:MAG: VCBS repeat-containing protein, partial [Verrucomicrobiales bacterium]|nr:VCBS repeat-containing protein [Verrucomicrobiales bacterium]
MLGLLFACIAGSAPAPEAIAQDPSPEHRFASQQLRSRLEAQTTAAVRYRVRHDFRFVDRVADSGITFRHRIVDDAGRTYKPAHYDHGNGLAVADVDGDGLPDLYFTTQLGRNQLWRNLGGGRFEDITEAAGVGWEAPIAVGASFADIDNDGDPDLFVTTVRKGNRLFENSGGGRFRDITREAGLEYSGHSSGAVFFDADNDGLLDLLVTNVGVYTEDRVGPGGYYLALADAFQGHLHPARTEYSRLYRNVGGRKFEPAPRSWGFRDGSWSGDATFADVNGDGFPDLYLVNMQGDDHLYENQGGKGFVERTSRYFPKTPWGAMGAKFFDYDLDGRFDLFVTDMHSDMTRPQTEQALSFRVDIEKAKSEAWCSAQWPDSYYQG